MPLEEIACPQNAGRRPDADRVRPRLAFAETLRWTQARLEKRRSRPQQPSKATRERAKSIPGSTGASEQLESGCVEGCRESSSGKAWKQDSIETCRCSRGSPATPIAQSASLPGSNGAGD